MLAGELSWKPTGQELTETADSVIAFVPTETSWRGSRRPHSIFTTPNGQMFGLDLYDRALIKSPTVIVTAASGEGKVISRVDADHGHPGSSRERKGPRDGLPAFVQAHLSPFWRPSYRV